MESEHELSTVSTPYLRMDGAQKLFVYLSTLFVVCLVLVWRWVVQRESDHAKLS